MKSLVLVLFSFISIATFGQKGSIWLGPTLSFETVDLDFKSDQFNENAVSSSDERLSFGLCAQYGLTEKLYLTSGALYTTQNISKDYNWVFLDPGDAFIPRTTAIQLDYLRVPLLFGWKVGFEKMTLLPSIGFNFDFLLNSTETSTFEDDSNRDSDFVETELNSPHTFASLDVLLSYNASEKVTLGIAPYLNQALNKLDNELVEKTETNLGGRFLLIYKLK